MHQRSQLKQTGLKVFLLKYECIQFILSYVRNNNIFFDFAHQQEQKSTS